MRYLFVTTFPPTHCGIGIYASQSVDQLRRQGHLVDVISPDGAGNVDFSSDLKGGWKILRLLRLAPFYDRVVVQYAPIFFYRGLEDPAFGRDSIRTTMAFILLFLFCRRRIEVLAHEVAYLGRRHKLNYLLYRWKWKVVPHLVLHTAAEREKLFRHYNIQLLPSRLELRVHHQDFRKFRDIPRNQARRELGLSTTVMIFLCIGFIQRHKGFDRAVAAFRQAGLAGTELYIAGSIRTNDLDNHRYMAEVDSLIRQTPSAHLVEHFLNDEEFDTWITATDWILLPYREIWSSSILARARLFGRPCIVSNVGGLVDQAGASDLFFETDEELEEALRLAMEIGAPAHA